MTALIWDRSQMRFVPPGEYYARKMSGVARSDLPSPMLIRDGMEPTLNPANGKRYDSKRAYERAVRAAGCEIIGNESPRAAPRPQLDDPVNDIREAMEVVQSRTPKPRKRRKQRGI